MKNVRVWFEKQGPVQYISHLDLTRCMARGLKLSRLPVWYTEGFNPRVYMTFAMPLSLGVCGQRECMDIRLTEDASLEDVPSRMNPHLPQGLRVLGASEPERKFEEIRWGEYQVFLEAGDPAALRSQLEALMGQEAILVKKHSKKGDREVDIKPDFAGLAMEEREGGLLLGVRLPCSVNGSVNPGLLLEALQAKWGEAPFATVVRKRLLLEDFSELR